mmetsp:Transcript_32806/g.103855  ORF Transcript_32806/g.103855 Transcript_32806/m.103855 type:complete len:210 (+) Transcript_32806:620-1249(+)
MCTHTSVSEASARSLTKRSRLKSTLAPEVMAATVHPALPFCLIHFLAPATPSAPAGSMTQRVSLKVSLMAWQISSVLTVTISSTSSWQTRKVSSPMVRTAAPSAKRPTWSSVVTSPAASDAVMPAASSASTPMMRTLGRTRFTYAATPASMPPPPQHTKMASSGRPVISFRISTPMVPCPAMTSASLKGCTSVRPSSRSSRCASAWASS